MEGIGTMRTNRSLVKKLKAIFFTSLVSLQLTGLRKTRNETIVIWKNSKPSSAHYCKQQILKTLFEKSNGLENKKTNLCLRKQKINEKNLCLRNFTMINGKLCHTVTVCFSIQRCDIYFVTLIKQIKFWKKVLKRKIYSKI